MAISHHFKHQTAFGASFWKLGFITVITVLIFLASQFLTKARFDSLPLSQISSTKALAQDQAKDVYLKLPISFEANHGQIDPKVRFMARGAGYNVFVTSDEVILALKKHGNSSKSKKTAATPEHHSKTTDPIETAVLRIKPVDANPNPEIIGLNEFRGKANYLTGKDSGEWQSDVPTFGKVQYKDIYPGIDLVWYGNQRKLEYDFVVAPGVDPGTIKLAVKGADKITLDREGNLIVDIEGEPLLQNKPVIYQEVSGVRHSVSGSYDIKSDEEIGFDVGEFDPNLPLIIDPILSYSSYLGGIDSDQGNSITTDDTGNVFITGSTASPDFPVGNAGAFGNGGSTDVFVTKLNTNESGHASHIFSTYIGGKGADEGNKIARDNAGNLYITGATSSVDFPLVNAIQSKLASSAFFKSTDAANLWSAAGAGLSETTVNSIAVDPNNPDIIYAAASSGFFKSIDGGEIWADPIENPNEHLLANTRDVIVDPRDTGVLYAATGGGIFKSTNGGSSWIAKQTGLSVENIPVTDIRAVAIDPETPSLTTEIINLYTGTAEGLFKSTDGGESWGRRGADTINGAISELAIDPSNPLVVYAGTDNGVIYKSENSGESWAEIQNLLSPIQALAVDPGSPSVLYSGTSAGVWKNRTQVLVNQNICSLAIGVSPANPPGPSSIYAGGIGKVFKSSNGGTNWVLSNQGQTNSSAIKALAVNPVDPSTVFLGTTGKSDAFLAKLNPTGSTLLYSTFFGGGSDDRGNGLAVDNDGRAYLTGATSSGNFPIAGGISSNGRNNNKYSGGADAFVAKVNTDGSGPSSLVYSTYLGGASDDHGNAVAADSSGNVYVTGSTSSSNFPTVAAYQTTYGNKESGVYKKTDVHAPTPSFNTWGKSGDGLSKGVRSLAGGDCSDSGCPPVYAGTNSGVFKRSAEDLVWQPINEGLPANSDISTIAIKRENSSVIYAGSSGGIFKSTDAGNTWERLGTNAADEFRDASFNTIAIGQAVYAGIAFGGIYRSSDEGLTWVLSSNGLPNTTTAGDQTTSTDDIRTIAIDPQNGTVFAGTSAGIYKSTDGGENWVLSSTGLPDDSRLPAPDAGRSTAIVQSVSVRGGVLYAGLSNAGIFKSTDGGANWSSTNFPDTDPGSIAISPVAPQIVYVGTEGGVFVSLDGGMNWSSNNSGLTTTTISAIYIREIPAETNAEMTSDVYAGVSNFSGDAFLAKINSAGNSLEYSTFLGGDDGDAGTDIALGASNAAYVTGFTRSALFPTTSEAFSTINSGGSDAFLAKLDTTKPGGESLIYGTFIGGQNHDQANSLAVENSGKTYLTGSTDSADFPVKDAVNNVYNGSNDAFVLALDPSAEGSNALISSTFLGGSGSESGFGIALDNTGNVFITGNTVSKNYPVTANAFDGSVACLPDSNCLADAFVAKLSDSNDSADLAFTAMGHSGTFRRGETGVFTIDVSNLGPSQAAPPIRVINTLSGGLSFDSASGPGWSCSADGQFVTCVHPEPFEPNQSASPAISIAVNVAADAPGSVSSSAVVSSTTGDPVADNNYRSASADVSPACANSISPQSEGPFPSGGGTGIINVTTEPGQNGCIWRAESAFDWIDVTAINTGTGDGTVEFSVAENQSPSPRTGIINVAGEMFTVNQAAFVCTYSISPASDEFPDTESTGSFTVTASPFCRWAAVSGSNFVHIDPDSSNGTGDGLVSFTVDENRKDTREATISVAGQKFKITQDRFRCLITLSPTGRIFPENGGSGVIEVSTNDGCNWKAVSNEPFITIQNGGSGDGNGTVSYSVAPNVAGVSRTGTISIGDESFFIMQNDSVCTDFIISPKGAFFSSDGGNYGSLFVDSPQDSCFWTAESSVDWLLILPKENGGFGSGDEWLTYSVLANPTIVSRKGTAFIAGRTFTLTQKGVQCVFALSAEAEYFDRNGGTGGAAVNTQDPCPWTAESKSSWITFTDGTNNTGGGMFEFLVAANPNVKSRTGIVSVAGKIFTVRQAGISGW